MFKTLCSFFKKNNIALPLLCFVPDKYFIVFPNCLPHTNTSTVLEAAASEPLDKSIKN